ncbi:hypothetical protein D3C85_1552960 [compost metagenome]
MHAGGPGGHQVDDGIADEQASARFDCQVAGSLQGCVGLRLERMAAPLAKNNFEGARGEQLPGHLQCHVMGLVGDDGHRQL